MPAAEQTTTKHPTNYEAWATNAITFIRERGLEIDFTNWSGGWKCPVPSDAKREVGRAMLAALKDAVYAHGPFGDDSRPSWFMPACTAIAAAEAAGIKAEG